MSISELINNVDVFLEEDYRLAGELGLIDDSFGKHYFYALVRSRLGEDREAVAIGAACEYLFLAQSLHASNEKTDPAILLGDYCFARLFQYLDVIGSPGITEKFMKYMLDHNLVRIEDAERNFTREEFQDFVESICTGK